MARLAITSFRFMFWDVPAPAWYTSTTNWSRWRPATISAAARLMAAARRPSRRPSERFTVAAASLTWAYARMNTGGSRRPLIGKFSIARRV